MGLFKQGTKAPRLLAISDERRLSSPGIGTWLDELHTAAVDALQIRAKGLPDPELEALTRRVVRLSKGRLRILVNGRADVAVSAGADGVHLPADGLPAHAVRRRFPSLLLGLSTHRADEILEARDDIDYATFGPVFDTPSKRAYGAPAGLDALRRVCELGVPILALGGVDADSIPRVAAAGASGAAAIRALQDGASLVEMGAAAAHVWPLPRMAPIEIDD